LRISSSILFLLSLFFVTACGQASTTLAPTSTPVPTQIPVSPTETTFPTTAPTQIPTQEPATTASSPSEPASGLVFSDDQGLWLVDSDGTPQHLLDQPNGALSPDGSQVVFSVGDPEDIWLADLVSGENRNLSNTPDRVEDSPQWWPAHPGVVVFLSASLEEPRFGYGHPTIVNLDGDEYQVLDPVQGGPVALSPDGQTLAFGCCDAPAILYNLNTGPMTFDPTAYGIGLSKLFTPAYSPDGQQLAWIASGGGELGLVIFDLQAMTSRFLHRFVPIGGGEFEFNLTWSPDGNWLAFTTFGEDPNLGRRPNLWVITPDGEQEFNLGVGFNPTWNPSGNWLAYSQEGPNPLENAIQILQSSSWDQPIQLTFTGTLKGWIQK
jgi:Tol biopolymer transport system component